MFRGLALFQAWREGLTRPTLKENFKTYFLSTGTALQDNTIIGRNDVFFSGLTATAIFLFTMDSAPVFCYWLPPILYILEFMIARGLYGIAVKLGPAEGGTFFARLKKLFCTATNFFKTADGATGYSGRWGIFGAWATAIIMTFLIVVPNLPIWLIWLAPLAAAAFYLILATFYKWLSGHAFFNSPGHECSRLQLWSGTLIVTAVVAAIFLSIVLLSGMSDPMRDEQLQWKQVQEQKFSDWHPVMHSYSIYLISKIHNTRTGVGIVFVLFFSMIMGWLYYSLRKYNYKHGIVLLPVILIAISPLCVFALRALLKDSAFMITALALCVVMVNLWHTDGKWLKWYLWPFVLLLLLYGGFVRHNGIFFTIPFALFLPLVAKTVRDRLKLCVFALLALMVTGGYFVLRAELVKHKVVERYDLQSFHEAVGIPMCMMSSAYVRAPEKVPPEAKAFLSKKLPWERWKELFKGDYNSVKFHANCDIMGDVTKKEFFRAFLLTTAAAPLESMEGFFYVTSVAWDPFWTNPHMFTWAEPQEQEWCIRYGWLFLGIGFYMLCLIISGFYALPRQGLKTVFLCAPYLAYACGTALLLMGWDHRFFWGILIGSIPLITVLFAAHRQKADGPGPALTQDVLSETNHAD